MKQSDHPLITSETYSYQEGVRCYRADLKRTIIPEFEATGYGIQIEILSVAARRGFHIDDVPSVFTDRENGNSKLDVTQILKYVWTAIRLLMLTIE